MPRLARHLLTLLAALSLLLFLATLLLWFRSDRCTERIVWQPTTGDYWLSTAKGSLVFGMFRVKNAYTANETFGLRYHREDNWASPPMSPFAVMELDPPLTAFDWEHAGVTLQTRTAGPRREFHLFLAARCWLLALLTAILPLTWTITRYRSHQTKSRRHSQGLCPTCGYDLRATLERCPECGAVPPSGAVREQPA